MTTKGKQYRTTTFRVPNTPDGISKLKDIRRDIRERKNNTNLTVFNLLASIAGLFHVTLGVGSAVFSGATTSNSTFLDNLEGFYMNIIEDFATLPGTIVGATIKQKFVGQESYVKGMMWRAQMPTVEFIYKYY